MGRPTLFTDGARVTLHAKGKIKLHEGSERRAIINLLVSQTGVMTLGAINRHFGYDIRPTVIALERAGWLDIKEGA